MATIEPLTLRMAAHTKAASIFVRLLAPLVSIGVVSPERAVSIAMHFVKMTVTVTPSLR